jgi:mono/diheme cytochrome c family protein
MLVGKYNAERGVWRRKGIEQLKSLWKLAIVVAGAFVVLQFVRPSIPSRPATAEIQAPPNIRQILDEHCYSCHSNQRRLAWFDEIQPGYWLVRRDILTARAHLNFSTLGSKPAAAQKATLYEAVNMIQLGAMPLPRFVALHPEAKVSPEDLAALKAYLSPWAPLPLTGVSQPPGVSNGTPSIHLENVSAEWNGVAFDPSFEGWKALSFTDRGDNDTFRFVLGNDIAIEAAESGNISPWPDGTRFAKIAWQQQPGSDGLIYPGAFVQVELMIKDAHKYASTDGWGWGRWRGLDLKPYGSNAHFVSECTTCHLPVKGNDHVYTLPITSARSSLQEAVNDRAAALVANLPHQPLRWTPITMFVDPRAHTMSTLFGNDVAIKSASARSASPAVPSYEQGAVLALVTWFQRDDPHWFGARIPDNPASVEFVTVERRDSSSYRRFDGPNLSEARPSSTVVVQRTSFLLKLKPASLP